MNPVGTPCTATQIAAYNSGVKEWALGTLIQDIDTGYFYKYVQISATSANAGSAGRAFYNSGTENVVSDDSTSGMNANDPAGIAVGTGTKGNYVFLLVKGEYSAVLKSAAAVVAGDYMIASGTDGMVATKTAGEYTTTPFGVFDASASAGAASVAGKVRLLNY